MRPEAVDQALDVRFGDLLELLKARVTGMVVVSAAAGILLAVDEPVSWLVWSHCLVGTALVAGGAAALNQVAERDIDGRMRRTAHRPLPAGHIGAKPAVLVGISLAVLGLLLLAAGTNPFTALLAASTLGFYLFAYTPLKRTSPLAALVGAVPGAMPPVIGWAAVRGGLDAGAWALFALLFFWQVPHVLAIGWLHRADYARGGLPVLSVRDPGGRRTARLALASCAALLPVSLLPSALGLTGWLYTAGALLSGSLFLGGCCAFAVSRRDGDARRAVRLSILYQPLVLAALVLDRVLV
jgi:protoheme IX farnesyltransferase